MRRAFDVFVSYRRPDRDWVRRHLLRAFERRGLTPFVDFLEPPDGQPTSVLLRKGQQRSTWILAVLTPSYSRSVFTDVEMRNALRTGRLVPVLARRCSLPTGI